MPDLTREQWSADVDALLAEVRGRNPGIFDRADEQAFIANAEELRLIGATLRPRQRATRLAQLMASLGQTHSYVDLSAPGTSLFATEFGIELGLFDEGFYVTCVANGNEDLFGKQVTKIGHESPENLYAAVSRLAGADNPWLYEILVRRRMNNIDLLRELGAFHVDDNPSLTLREGGKNRVAGALPSAGDRECIDARDNAALNRSYYWRNTERPYWAEIIDGTDILYLQINSMLEDDNLSYENFGEALTRMYVEYEPTRIIIDLRRNIGGNAIPARTLTKAILSHRPFGLKGGTIILISPETLSASVVFAQELALFSPVAYVGRPTGSDGNQWGDNQYVVLPNSKLTVSIATAYYQTAGPYGGRGPLLPEHYIDNSADSYFKVLDPALEFAISYSPDPSVKEIFRSAQAKDLDPISALSSFVLNPERQFQDLERPLRLLSRSVAESDGITLALKVNDLLVQKHPQRSRSFMERASTLESMRQIDQSIDDWNHAALLIDDDESLTQSLKHRLREVATAELSRLQRAATNR